MEINSIKFERLSEPEKYFFDIMEYAEIKNIEPYIKKVYLDNTCFLECDTYIGHISIKSAFANNMSFHLSKDIQDFEKIITTFFENKLNTTITTTSYFS